MAVFRGCITHKVERKSARKHKDDGRVIDLNPYGRIIALYLGWQQAVFAPTQTERSIASFTMKCRAFKVAYVRCAKRHPENHPCAVWGWIRTD